MIKEGLTMLYPASSSPDLLECWEVSTNTTEADTVCFQYNSLLIAKSIIIEPAFRANRPCGGGSNGSINLLDAVVRGQIDA